MYLDDDSHLEADELLVATGRRANVNDLGLEIVGVDADGPLDVDVTMRVKAVSDGWLTGRAKIVVDEDRKILLGATFVGPGVVDHLHAATIAVTAEVPLDRLWHAVPAFPTTSEVWLQLLEAYGL